MNYPTTDEIIVANRVQICKWMRYLASPHGDSEVAKMNLICARFKELGGFSSEISKSIGWEGHE